MGKRANGEGSWSTVTLKGNVYQMYRITTVDGKRKSFYGKTKKEAQEKYKKYISLVNVEEDNQNLSFYDYCHNWLFGFKKDKVKPKTFDYYDFIIEDYIKDTKLGNYKIKKLNEMNKKQILDLFNSHIKQYAESKAKSTIDGIHTVLLQVCKYGVNYQDFLFNFMENVEKISEKDVVVKKKEIEALEYADVMKLWNEMLRRNEEDNIVNNKAGTYVYGIGAYALLFCCFTGLRWGEVSILKWEDIKEQDGKYYFKVDKQYITIKNRDEDSERSYMTVEAEPKSEKSNRYIPLSYRAIMLLDLVKERYPKCHKDNHLIFSTTNNPYSASTANRLLKAMCIRAGVPMVTPHTLRHSFASILLNEDEKNLYAVSDLLGHSSPDVTYKKYIDIFEKNKINAVNLFDKLDD